MKEIKFRAWNGVRILPVAHIQQDFEELINLNGSNTYEPTDLSIELANGDSLHFDPMYSNDERLMQYIGLKDRNGTDIYHSDILQAGSDVAIVGWNKEKATFCLRKNGWLFAHFFGEAIDADQCEVIGNIFENPELLEK